jgi:2-iminobutanoate/2-iminopropanoate deaminase
MSLRTPIHTESAPKAIGPYSQAITAGGMAFCSGQIPIDPATGNLVEGGIEAQTHQAFRNLSAVLQAAGSDLARVVKTTVFLQSMGDFAAMNAVYATYFTQAPPARSTIEVAKLPKGALVEIEAIAII